MKSQAIVRSATPGDAAAIAHVHVASWRSTYRDLLPAKLLSELSVERRTSFWSNQLAAHTSDPNAGAVFVSEEGGGVVGFASAGPERETNSTFAAELYAIYLLEECQGRGIGRELVRRVIDYLLTCGRHSMRVWVLKGNRAEGFYTRLGGSPVGEKRIDIGGCSYLEVAYGWDDLGIFKRENG